MIKATLLASVLLTGLAAAEPTDPASDYLTESAKAQEAFDASLSKATATAIKSLSTIATTAVKRGDMAEAAQAWKEVLRFDQQHADARAFFTATGNLEQVLEETSVPRPIPASASGGTKMPASALTVTVSPADNAERKLGPAKAGTTVVLQYANGTWTRGGGRRMLGGPQNPDDATSDRFHRLAIVDCSGATPVMLAMVPPGTSATPFTYQLTKDVAQLGLWIVPDNRTGVRTNGAVTYKVAVKKR